MIRLLFLILGTLIASPVFAAAPGEVVRSYPTPSARVTGLAGDGTHLWVVDHHQDELHRLDPKDGRIIETLEAPAFRATGVTFDGEQLWVADRAESMIYRFDRERRLTTRAIRSPLPRPEGLAWDGTHLWLSGARAGELVRVDPTDGTSVTRIPAPSPDVTKLDFDGRYLWAVDRIADKIYALDHRQGDVLLILPAPGPHSSGIAVVGDNLLVADYQTNLIYELHKTGRAVTTGDDRPIEVLYLNRVRNHGPGTLATVDIHLALPEDRRTQTLIGPPRLTPEPHAVVEDQWGQRFAHFRFEEVEAGGEAVAQIEVTAALRSKRHHILPEEVGPLHELPPAATRRYLVDGAKLDLEHPTIQRIVSEVVGDESNPYWIARRLARHVQDAMYYELAGGWNAAPTVLERGSGSCSEYTFAFMALCRAAGLPARYVGAYVIRGDDASTDDVFHRWPEIYLPRVGWLPFDVQAGDRDLEAERGAVFGALDDRFLITTVGGGDSNILGWTYNSRAEYTCRGRCKVARERLAEWEPGGDKEPEGAKSPSGDIHAVDD